jgi:hypothetical protein
MKKFVFGVITFAVVVGVVVYCSSDDDYQISDWTWKEEKPKLITWEKLDTFVFESEGFKVEYPSTFMVDTTETEVDFLYEVDDEMIYMRCYSMMNSEDWDEQTAADYIAQVRKAVINDSVVMKDMHPGYFYLKGYDDEKGLGFYGQYVVDKDVIYTYELCYPKNMENRMQRLMDLIHNWNPEARR